MAGTNEYFVGLDIGGTTIKSMLVDQDGETVGEMLEVRSHVDEGFRRTFGQLIAAVDGLCGANGLGRGQVAGVGLDVPAPCCDGVIWSKANLAQDWVGVNIAEEFEKEIGVPLFMTNDGNAAAAGEYAVRPDHTGSLLLAAPGTGLAGGLVLAGGRIYEGANGLSLEVGHNSVPFREDDGSLPECTCGQTGCVEAWVSLMALRRRLGLELKKEKWAGHVLNKDGAAIAEKAFRLRDLAQAGDELAIEIFKQQGFIFGHALADLARLFDPGLMVIGGGLAESSFRDQYLEWIMEGFESRAWPIYLKSPINPEQVTTDFQWAMGGDSAAALGMAFAARMMFGRVKGDE
jgi:predicted NBD/HSP70 family sugar kinase